MAVAALAAAIHLFQTASYALPSGQFKNLHVGLSLIIVYLSLAESSSTSSRKAAFVLAALVCLIPVVYIHLEFGDLITDRMFEANGSDTFVSVILIATTLLAVAVQWGVTIPLIVLIALAYAYLGPYMPGELLFHGGIGMRRLVSYASIPFFQGLLGSLTSISAGTVFVLMLFAGLLKSTGGIDFIMSVGAAVSGRSRAGPARIAVISSGFMGMISGSTVANTASTGSVTIPLMKSFGFRGEHAAAIEAAASTGGQFAPPVMGLTAFLIAGMTGIPYNRIMLAGVFPALVYYGYLLAAVNLQGRIDEAMGRASHATELPATTRHELIESFLQHGHLLVAIGVLVFLLVVQMPPAFAAVYAMAVIVCTEATKSVWQSRKAPWNGVVTAVRTLLRGLDEGARMGAQLAIVIAAIGIFVDVLVTTGFAQKLSYMILDLASGQLWLMLAMTAVACLAFGLGMPTPAAYILVALLGVPALEQIGVPELSAHMFVFYFANMSAVTPPVALAALVAAKLAEANYIRTALAACRLGLAGFILPFLFVYAPAILLLEGSVLDYWITFFISLLALVVVNAALVGYALERLSLVSRVTLIAAAVLLLQFDVTLTIAGLTCVVLVLATQYLRKRTGA